MTINEANKHVIQTLEGIRVPMSEIQSIGAPVSQCIEILRQCTGYMDDMERKEAEAKRAEEEEKEPEDGGAAEAPENENGQTGKEEA